MIETPAVAWATIGLLLTIFELIVPLFSKSSWDNLNLRLNNLQKSVNILNGVPRESSNIDFVTSTCWTLDVIPS